jgi:hypothetical protein
MTDKDRINHLEQENRFLLMIADWHLARLEGPV